MNSDLVRPLITDHLHPRPRPLYMALMQGVRTPISDFYILNIMFLTAGSIAHPDSRLEKFDLLTCIEVYVNL